MAKVLSSFQVQNLMRIDWIVDYNCGLHSLTPAGRAICATDSAAQSAKWQVLSSFEVQHMMRIVDYGLLSLTPAGRAICATDSAAQSAKWQVLSSFKVQHVMRIVDYGLLSLTPAGRVICATDSAAQCDQWNLLVHRTTAVQDDRGGNLLLHQPQAVVLSHAITRATSYSMTGKSIDRVLQLDCKPRYIQQTS